MKLLGSKENRLLGRREMEYWFVGASGSLSRGEAAKLVAGQLSVQPESVIPIRLAPVSGTRDIRGLFYVYGDPEEAKRQLPEYLFLRGVSREERARLLEERRKAKAAERTKAASAKSKKGKGS